MGSDRWRQRCLTSSNCFAALSERANFLQTLSFFLFLSLSLCVSHSLTHTHTHTHTHFLSFTLILPHTHTHSLSLSLCLFQVPPQLKASSSIAEFLNEIKSLRFPRRQRRQHRRRRQPPSRPLPSLTYKNLALELNSVRRRTKTKQLIRGQGRGCSAAVERSPCEQKLMRSWV